MIWMKGKEKIRIWAAVFWLCVWQAGSMALGQKILLVSPVLAVRRLLELAITAPFWQSVGFSLLRVAAGFLAAAILGVLLAALAVRFIRVEELLSPLMLAIKTTPVASFIILLLIWISSRNLSVYISFLMVLPVIYTNVRDGIRATDQKLLEMAQVFRVPAGRVTRYIYLSQVLPFFRAACSVALGLCWKAGVAAEVIGIPQGSIGEMLYNAKIYLNTPDLFAWTLMIILLSLAFERLVLAGLDWGAKRLERM